MKYLLIPISKLSNCYVMFRSREVVLLEQCIAPMGRSNVLHTHADFIPSTLAVEGTSKV